MLTTMLLSFLLVLCSVAAMATGVLLSNRRIRGSCGGVGGEGCELCSARRPDAETDDA